MADLPDQLRELGQRLDARPADDLADRVLARVCAVPPRGHPAWRGPWRSRWRLVALVAGVIVALVGGVVAVSPPVRAAIAHFFGGVRIHTSPSHLPTPTARPSPLPGEHRTDLDGAAREVGFRVRLPAALGAPSEVTVADGRVVSLRYRGPHGPIRVDEFAGDLGPMWDKYTHVLAQPVDVGGRQGLWFAGPVVVEYVDRDGNPIPATSRTTGDTLIWIDGPLTFRLDGVASRADAVTIAESMP